MVYAFHKHNERSCANCLQKGEKQSKVLIDEFWNPTAYTYQLSTEVPQQKQPVSKNAVQKSSKPCCEAYCKREGKLYFKQQTIENKDNVENPRKILKRAVPTKPVLQASIASQITIDNRLLSEPEEIANTYDE